MEIALTSPLERLYNLQLYNESWSLRNVLETLFVAVNANFISLYLQLPLEEDVVGRKKVSTY